jgi:hypothetical protein
MKLSVADQLVLGLWISVVVGIGIISVSGDAAISALIAGAFFLTPFFAPRFLKSPVPAFRYGSIVVMVAWVGWFAFASLNIAERLYFVHASSYPSWLASGVLSLGQPLDDLRSSACKGRGPLEIIEKPDGLYLVRCGLMWYDSKTFIAHFDPIDGAQ